MKILFVVSEAAPFVKTGGLGEVTGSLPKALAKTGMDVRVVMPKYASISQAYIAAMQPIYRCQVQMGWHRTRPCTVYSLVEDGVTFYFLENDYLFNRPEVYGAWDDGERFAFFCQGVLAALPGIGFQPDLIHCHDWQTAMLPLVLAAEYCQQPFYQEIATVLTIHNLKYQGIFPPALLEMFNLSADYFNDNCLEYYGNMNFLKGGIAAADGVTTVSPTYAREILTPDFGEGLDGFLRTRQDHLWGIINGIDQEVYDPARDVHIHQNFAAASVQLKAENKKHLQLELGLPIRPEVPLITLVGRLTGQKGMNLICPVLEEILQHDLQLVVMGNGEHQFEDAFRYWANHRSEKCKAVIGYQDDLAHRIYAAGDIFLMPSLFEPCGIGQMIAMRYGSLPLVRNTGGLRDSVYDYQPKSGEGNGFSFTGLRSSDLLSTLDRALAVYSQPAVWQRIMLRDMAADFSWQASSREYAALYQRLVNQRQGLKEE